MTAIDDEERSGLDDAGRDDDAPGGDDDGALTCPECGDPFTSRLSLGAHRFQKHGVRGSKRQPTGRPRGRPKGSKTRAASDGESGRQARRRKAVRETLIEFVSFTDEARGRGEPNPAELADVIRRDADKIANSIAWAAEKFNPLGRLIDTAFGHGSILTFVRGFLGVGTWTLAKWRAAIEQRQRPQELLSAEELDAQMRREYLT